MDCGRVRPVTLLGGRGADQGIERGRGGVKGTAWPNGGGRPIDDESTGIGSGRGRVTAESWRSVDVGRFGQRHSGTSRRRWLGGWRHCLRAWGRRCETLEQCPISGGRPSSAGRLPPTTMTSPARTSASQSTTRQPLILSICFCLTLYYILEVLPGTCSGQVLNGKNLHYDCVIIHSGLSMHHPPSSTTVQGLVMFDIQDSPDYSLYFRKMAMAAF